MKTQQIPRVQWAAFFDRFSREHEGRRATLEIFGPDIGDQIEERELTLGGITAELTDAGDNIEIMLGVQPSDHLTHTIAGPDQVGLEQTDEGADEALAIKASDGTTTLLHFRSAALPQSVSGTAT